MWGRLIGIVVMLLAAAGIGWALWPRPLSVETAQIERRDLTVTVEEEGMSRIREIFRVSAPVAGTLTRVTMHVGDAVSAGQTVATIEPAGPGLLDDRSRRMAQAAVEAAEAGVALAEANLAQAEAQFAYATAELERASALADRALVSTQVEQRSVLEAATAREGVAAAKATLLIRQQEWERARAALIEGQGGAATDTCCAVVSSPITGRILEILIESEQVVQPGTPLMDIGDPQDLEIVVEVLSSDAVRLSDGAAATIERWGGEPLRAVVKRIDPVAFTSISALGIEEQRTRVVLELLDGSELRSRLGHGFRAVAKIVIWKGEDLVVVPMGALSRRGEAWVVFVVEDGAARLRTVGLGQRNNEYAEVVSGLDAGEVVIVHPGDTVEDGRSVVPIELSDGSV